MRYSSPFPPQLHTNRVILIIFLRREFAYNRDIGKSKLLLRKRGTTLAHKIQLEMKQIKTKQIAGCVEIPRAVKFKMGGVDSMIRTFGFMVNEGELVKTGDNNMCYVGVSKKRNGSMGLSMQMVIVPPQNSYVLDAFQGEVAVYVVNGHAEHHMGAGQKIYSGAGDFIYVASGVCAVTRNVGNTEPVVLIISQNSILPCAEVAVNRLYAA